MSCNRCSKTHSTVLAFLLTCCVCHRKWHHRCHIPPIADSELIRRIRAHNVGDSANGLQTWKCKSCARNDVGSTPILNLPLPHSSAARAPPPISNDVVQGSKNDDDAVIVIDDSDSDSDSDSLQPNHPGLSKSKRAFSATQTQSPAIAKAINSNLRPSRPPPLVVREQKEAHSTLNHPPSSNDHSALHPRPTSLSSHQLAQPMTTTTDDDDIVVINPSQFQNKETMRNQFRRDAKERERIRRMERSQQQQQLLKVKSEAKEAVDTIASNLDTSSHEPIPQPQTPEVTSSVGHLSVEAETFARLSAAQKPGNVSQQEVNLAPRWFHDDSNDIWARALRNKTFIPPSSITRRKIQGKQLNEARPPIFNFNIMQWENRMKRV